MSKQVAPIALFVILVIAWWLLPTRAFTSDHTCSHSRESFQAMDCYHRCIHPPVNMSGRRLVFPAMNSCSQHRSLADNVNIQSICPWEYFEHHDENRYPHGIVYARCTCPRCLNNQFQCRPVYHNIPVIRQICRNGEYIFVWDFEEVPVGCTCSHPSRKRSVRKKWFLG